MDPFEELERMAQNATETTDLSSFDEEIERWMTLFSYKDYEARTLILVQRSDITRDRISEAHWSLIRSEYETAGHSKESYEHLLGLKDLFKSQSSVVTDKSGGEWVVFRMGGVLGDGEKVKEVLGREGLPRVTSGLGGEGGMVEFCWVTKSEWEVIKGWLDGLLVVGK